MNNKGFTIVELFSISIILSIIFLIAMSFYNKLTKTCLEYEVVPTMECYSWGKYHSTCEQAIRKRCIKYE